VFCTYSDPVHATTQWNGTSETQPDQISASNHAPATLLPASYGEPVESFTHQVDPMAFRHRGVMESFDGGIVDHDSYGSVMAPLCQCGLGHGAGINKITCQITGEQGAPVPEGRREELLVLEQISGAVEHLIPAQGTSFHETYRCVDVPVRNIVLLMVCSRSATDSLSDELFASGSRRRDPKPTIFSQILPDEPLLYNDPMASSHFGSIMDSSYVGSLDFCLSGHLLGGFF
jgi:hypothetical protein